MLPWAAPTNKLDLVKLYSEPRRPLHARSEADLLMENPQQQMICQPQRAISDWMLSSGKRLRSSTYLPLCTVLAAYMHIFQLHFDLGLFFESKYTNKYILTSDSIYLLLVWYFEFIRACNSLYYVQNKT